MASLSSLDGEVPMFYIGHHDTKREHPITDDVIQHSQSHNYDMITAPITTNAFYSRVTSILSTHLTALQQSDTPDSPPHPVLGNISCADISNPETHLRPVNFIPQLILTCSPWIDLASPDPLIANISRQVLSLELQYAAFCGASNVIVAGPRLDNQGHNGLAIYARALQEALHLAPFVVVHIAMPMGIRGEVASDIFNLSSHARKQFTGDSKPQEKMVEQPFASWDAWNLIRSLCTYSGRLSKTYNSSTFDLDSSISLRKYTANTYEDSRRYLLISIISSALEFPQKLPSFPVQLRWFSEPLRVLQFSSKSFIRHTTGEVMLSQDQKQLLFHYMRLKNPPWITLNDVGPLPGIDSSSGSIHGYQAPGDGSHAASIPADPTPAQAARIDIQEPANGNLYLTYLRQLQDRQPPKDVIDRYSAGYQDYLQNPLQPLTDNLESMTYEVFEKDPIKYDWYERATAAALKDWVRKGKPGSGRDGSIVVAVVGAGRGPLVTRALQASQATNVRTDVWALEKNPNAFALLQRHFSEKWHKRVNLARSDMRSWEGPFYYADGASQQKIQYKVDILISELLGSFGDNELSPECLDGVQHVLNHTHGISIPSSYTAHLTPLAAPRLHMDISTRIASGSPDAAEIPYVVLLHAVDYLSKQQPSVQLHPSRDAINRSLRPSPVILEAWEFVHPSNASRVKQPGRADVGHGNEHNQRFAHMEFPCKERGVCHGLGGYFEAVLFDPNCNIAAGTKEGTTVTKRQGAKRDAVEKVELSTNPLTMNDKSKDMISWFPIFFPLKTPLYFPDNSVLCVSIWRQTDGRKVWYEWLVESFLLSGHQRIRLGATELHSSVKNACLM